jgi:hypothetical protein
MCSAPSAPDAVWNEVGIYTDHADFAKVWGALSHAASLPTQGCQLYTRPIDDPVETRLDDFDIMLFHGAFSDDFHRNFLKSVTRKPDIVCYVSGQSTIGGEPIRKFPGLKWRVLRIPPEWL